MLIIKDLSLYLRKDLRPLLYDFSFSLMEGMKVALIGEEGNGKSTLLKAIARPESLRAYVEMEGEIIKTGEIIGYLPQVPDEAVLDGSVESYLRHKVGWANLDYALYYRLLAEMGFPEERISEKITLGQLSGGEKIKFQLLCEMLKRPTVLLLDEPSNDLDLASVQWLEHFIQGLEIPVMFVSHDELLLENCANTIIHLEQLIKKSKPQYTIAGLRYSEYVQNREERIIKQTQLAKKEKEEYDAKMERYRQIYQRVQHELRTVSRQEPSVAKNLKDKMHSVKSMGRRFEREKERMTPKPDFEQGIDVGFSDAISIPNGKRILDLYLDVLQVGDLVLARHVSLNVVGPQKMCIVGANGSGKTTLLRRILQELKQSSIPYGYMPQDYADTMGAGQTAVEFLASSRKKGELTKVRTYLGSMNFTKEEMFRPLSELSGGQRAKLYFSKMILERAEVLILDEPTRNLSPLSGPEIRAALKSFGGCIIAVSHDRKFIGEVFTQVFLLDRAGLRSINCEQFVQTEIR
ncbi:MAG TPA: ABC-F family ATP-binding cassette domain-containing protein [Firmicutes bacterium]|nr:ABC-F family ATP-binding cassette domain-containing protein [Bacillota bacterium]